MHYTGTIWRPPYEADSLIIEATAGCTHHACKFCTLYADLPFKFRPSPIEHIEADLLEAQTWYHDPLRKAEERLFETRRASCERIFLAGANPFGLKAKGLLEIAGLVHGYFPECRSIGCFSRITDVARKTDAELTELAAAGYDGLTLGIETGDDDALAFMNKGYGARDIVEQCARLDAAGISYAFFYLVGIAGKGRGLASARRRAAVVKHASVAYRRQHAHGIRELRAAPGNRRRQLARSGRGGEVRGGKGASGRSFRADRVRHAGRFQPGNAAGPLARAARADPGGSRHHYHRHR